MADFNTKVKLQNLKKEEFVSQHKHVGTGGGPPVPGSTALPLASAATRPASVKRNLFEAPSSPDSPGEAARAVGASLCEEILRKRAKSTSRPAGLDSDTSSTVPANTMSAKARAVSRGGVPGSSGAARRSLTPYGRDGMAPRGRSGGSGGSLRASVGGQPGDPCTEKLTVSPGPCAVALAPGRDGRGGAVRGLDGQPSPPQRASSGGGQVRGLDDQPRPTSGASSATVSGGGRVRGHDDQPRPTSAVARDSETARDGGAVERRPSRGDGTCGGGAVERRLSHGRTKQEAAGSIIGAGHGDSAPDDGPDIFVDSDIEKMYEMLNASSA